MLAIRRLCCFFACFGLFFTAAQAEEERSESELLTGIRQLTYEGKRAGEGYFGPGGRRMVFQSEREDENPFYQIYLMDLETGDTSRISPGHGKTTCAWIHPAERQVLFASTHDDPEARQKMADEIAFRESGQERRYSWDYDEHYDLYVFDFDGNPVRKLTDAKGYDAEGSWSPDGSQIAFASNRLAYSKPMSEKDAEIFELDKAYMMDIYIMDADGSNVRRLTDTKGYDGGPFFSPDGKRITWRRFSEDGARAEIYTMNTDGTDQRQITALGAMSWAPYYHPSGDYLIFATNVHGFANFELYLVDVEGEKEPARVTFTDGFDGLPVFSPDGSSLAWTSNRTADKTSQIFIAAWNDEKARELLGIGGEGAAPVVLEDMPDITTTRAEIRPEDMRLHIEYLASEQMQGRRSGTEGELKATQYIAEVFAHLGLSPAGDDGTYFQEYEFTAGVNPGPDNEMIFYEDGHPREFIIEDEWRPIAYSKTGAVKPSDIAFAGYGIKAPASDGFEEYDSFVHLDVTDKWVMVFRYMPENISPERRQHLSTHSSLRYKAMTLRDLGAAGMIVVSGPNSQVEDQLVPLGFDASLGTTSIAAVSVTDAVAEHILRLAGKDLKELQDALDGGDVMMGFDIPKAVLSANIDIEQEQRTGRNVLARLYADGAGGSHGLEARATGAGRTAIAVGAHADHLGVGAGSGSLSETADPSQIHYGADDNASGVAGVLEIAEYLKGLKDSGEIELKHDVLFAAWSGEELGLLGAHHFTDTYGGGQMASLQEAIGAYLNMDMIGRLDEQVVIGDVASSDVWPREIERRNAVVGLPIITSNDTYLPTDATAFYLHGVPFLNAFTNIHEDYHKPSDTADKINYEGAAQVARFMGLVARSLATSEGVPAYLEQEQPENMEVRANLRAYLGTIPDYAEGDVPGLKISGVTKGAPAEEAGLQAGDIIVELAGRKIENIYDYTFAIEALKVGEPVKVVVMRGGERVEAEVTPGSRE